MKKVNTTLAALLAVLLIAGCGTSSAPAESSAASGTENPPSYTYKNPDPDAVLLYTPDGEITYESFRLALDVGDEMNRQGARSDLALAAVVAHDKELLGITIDEEAYAEIAAQEIVYMGMTDPNFGTTMDAVTAMTGFDLDRLTTLIGMTSRMGYLGECISVVFLADAEKDLPAPDTAASQPAAESEASSEPDTAAVEAEQARQQKILEAAQARLMEYQKMVDEKMDFSDDSVLVTYGDEKIPYGENDKDYIEMMVALSKVQLLETIKMGEAVKADLAKRVETPDTTKFEEGYQQYLEIRSNPSFVERLTPICDKFGATIDDYLAALKGVIWYEYAAEQHYNAVVADYEKLPADMENKPADADAYYQEVMATLTDGYRIAAYEEK